MKLINLSVYASHYSERGVFYSATALHHCWHSNLTIDAVTCEIHHLPLEYEELRVCCNYLATLMCWVSVISDDHSSRAHSTHFRIWKLICGLIWEIVSTSWAAHLLFYLFVFHCIIRKIILWTKKPPTPTNTWLLPSMGQGKIHLSDIFFSSCFNQQWCENDSWVEMPIFVPFLMWFWDVCWCFGH